jgi:exodeoxyribonuclease III
MSTNGDSIEYSTIELEARNMKVATYNVNSIRQRLPLVLDWITTNNPDVMCLQETKVQDHEFPEEAIRKAGYYASYRGMKAYNGVATLSLTAPEKVIHGLHEGPDNEDFRILQTVVKGIPIINSYVPQGYSISSEKYAFKLEWFRRLRAYFEAELTADQPAIWVGDLNVAPEPIDVYHPEKRVNDVDFHIDARTAYKETVAWGFVDVFRKLHPEVVQYTYWDYFRNAVERNFGWRIDHILATVPLAERCRSAAVDMAARKVKGASDHTVVWAEFD